MLTCHRHERHTWEEAVTVVALASASVHYKLRCNLNQLFEFQGPAKPHHTRKQSLQIGAGETQARRPTLTSTTSHRYRMVSATDYSWARKFGRMARVGVRFYDICSLASMKAGVQLILWHQRKNQCSTLCLETRRLAPPSTYYLMLSAPSNALPSLATAIAATTGDHCLWSSSTEIPLNGSTLAARSLSPFFPCTMSIA